MKLELSDGLRAYDFLGGNDIFVREDGIEFPTVPKDSVFAEGVDSEGRSRVRTRAQNGEGGFSVYVQGATPTAFWQNVDNLIELVESAHNRKGTLTYRPPNGDDLIWDLESITVSGLPQRGVTLRQNIAEAEVTFECRPYGRRAEASLVTNSTVSGPIGSIAPGAIAGQVDAWGRLTLTDLSTQARQFVEVGVQEDYDSGSPEPLALAAVTDLAALASVSTTRSGSNSTNVLRATLTTSPVAICTTGSRTHKNLWKVRVRVYATSTNVRVRLAWRQTDGALIREKWVKVPGANGWYDVDLGTINIPTGGWQGRIEAFVTTGTPTVDVDYIHLIPAAKYIKLRGMNPDSVNDSSIVAADDFDSQTAGNLHGKTPPVVPSGTWSTSGATTDFVVGTTVGISGTGGISRSAYGDTTSGRFARAGTGVATNVSVSTWLKHDYNDVPVGAYGVFARYTDANNYLRATYYWFNNGVWVITKVVAGTATDIAGGEGPSCLNWNAMRLTVDTAGVAKLFVGTPGYETLVCEATDAVLATSETLQTGGYGIWDFDYGSSVPRYYDNFSVTASASANMPAIHSTRKVEWLHNKAQTRNSGDTAWGPTPIREGEYLKLPPATRANTRTRIVVRARRNDIDAGFTDTGLADSLRADLAYTPRVQLGKA